VRRLAGIPAPIALLAVLVGEEIVRYIGRELGALVPAPPADPGLWPVLPRLPLVAYAVALVVVFGSERSGMRPPESGPRRWLPLLLIVPLASFLGLITGGIRPGSVDAVLLRTALAAGAEEIIYRGIILALLLPRGGRAAALISTLLFVLGHLIDTSGFHPENWFSALNAFGGGLIFAAVRLRSGSVYPGIVVHAAYNIIEALRWHDTPLIFLLDSIWPFVMSAAGLVALRAKPEKPRASEPPPGPA
jgi:membrane protease YdiL (CAAX protease family)